MWAATNRIYPQTAAIPGPRDPHLTPYVVGPERMIASGQFRRVVMVFGAQTGKSEAMLDVAGQRLDQRPGPILYVGPNRQFLTEQFEPRVMSLLEQAPTLTEKLARGKRMTKTRKMVACWPCPHCSEYFVPRFNLMRYPAKVSPMKAARETYLECPHCGGVIEDGHKAAMNERGQYVAPGQTIDRNGQVSGDPPDTMSVSYWVSGLASPFVSFGDRIRVYLEAIALGDDAMVQQAINAGFGELYSPGGGEVPEWAEIKEKARHADYRRGEVPDGVLRLSIAADVQKQSIPYVIRGWGSRATSWLIDWGYLRGDTAEADVWNQLAELISTPIDGLPIHLTFVDSGFRPGKADTLPLNRVYEFCRRFPKRVRPTKGSSAPMRVPLLMSKIEVNRSGKAAKFGLDLVRLDTDHWKCWVHERLRWPSEMPGAWNVPVGIDDDYCHQIVSEARVKSPTGRPEWIRRSKNNHFLDCEAMLAATSYLMNMQRVGLPREREAPARTNENPPPPNEVPPTHRTLPRAPRRIVRSGYLGV
ncbi:phage terminase large subunit GpA-like protein [Bradyrhizobium japonicum]|uniref:terminase gpA endonuclease subunit n=1 Tax=Bradyrhizobium TaxID=374 RepID=UPI000675D9A4|nr:MULTISPECIES: terminase gpA endonuclease subunit [Bradyrhizobium]MBR1002695.1 phage terminase large subunit family protein [Bradyrhizobium liaoningense]MCP1744307.1 phage terminase large subunit GpA-like protein [Bradyrhizobium japonicum]MCP1892779.1 phage terminase large subunit GpA-like protein [Bradyrhizobium japonicum]MCW2325904.1 phage terminase large subunit GpA-like protein [Bradyrhizobium japonicum]WLC00081.1 phage terminase large subunit family protein [Bradyrhizobium japonicum USD